MPYPLFCTLCYNAGYTDNTEGAMSEDDLQAKLQQAEYHRVKMDSNDHEIIKNEFAAFLAAWRSIVMYIEQHLRKTEPDKHKRWDRIHAWEKSNLKGDEPDQWRTH